MGRLSSAKSWRATDAELQRLFNMLIDLLDVETRHEGKINGKNIVVSITARYGLLITVDGVETFNLDPVTGEVAISTYDAELAKVVYKSAFLADSILAADVEGVPAPVVLGEGEVLGRIVGGDITGLTASDIVGFIGSIVDPMTSRGDMLLRDSTNANARLAIGADNTHLASDGLDPQWVKSRHTHSQPTPSATWVITHNLARYPSVTVVDSAGSKVYGDITYDTENQITITFTATFSGTAYLD